MGLELAGMQAPTRHATSTSSGRRWSVGPMGEVPVQDYHANAAEPVHLFRSWIIRARSRPSRALDVLPAFFCETYQGVVGWCYEGSSRRGRCQGLPVSPEEVLIFQGVSERRGDGTALSGHSITFLLRGILVLTQVFCISPKTSSLVMFSTISAPRSVVRGAKSVALASSHYSLATASSSTTVQASAGVAGAAMASKGDFNHKSHVREHQPLEPKWHSPL